MRLLKIKTRKYAIVYRTTVSEGMISVSGALLRVLLLLLCVLSGAAAQQHTAADNSNLSKQTLGEKNKELKASELNQSYIRQIEEIGKKIYVKDHFGAVATDMLVSRIDPREYPNLVGWLVFIHGEKVTVHFYLEKEDTISVLADIEFDQQKGTKIELNPLRTVSKEELTAFRARKLGLEKGVNGCFENYNTVILRDDLGNYEVYVLAASKNPTEVVVGGHSKVTVSPDGRTVLSHMSYSKSCLVIDGSPKNPESDSEIVGFFMSHILSFYPAPTHVFLNLLHKKQLMIETDFGTWSVKNGKIKLVSESRIAR